MQIPPMEQWQAFLDTLGDRYWDENKNTVKTLSTLTTALVLFGLSGSAIAAFVPYLFAGSSPPDVAVFFVVGSAIMLLTAVLFGYIDRLGMGFGKTTLVLATGYNALIAAVKLWLAPAALYVLSASFKVKS